MNNARITLRLPGDVKAWLGRLKAEEGQSLNKKIVEILKAARAADHSKGAVQ